MKTAIIILNYNDYDTTFRMIQNINKFNNINTIVVVDNCSTDNSYKKLKELENKKIKVIKTNKNLGYASGNNYGLKYLEDKNIDFVIISNPDVSVSNDAINILKKDLEKDDITLIAPVINERGFISRGWKLPKFKDDLLSNINYFWKYFQKLLFYKDNYYNNKKLVQVDVVHGCFFIIKYDRFKKINFFDTGTFLYYEENILGKKLKSMGYKCFIDTSVVVNHELSVSVDKNLNSLKKYKILKESQRYYEKKYNNLNFLGLVILKISYYISYFISYIYLFFLKNIKK